MQQMPPGLACVALVRMRDENGELIATGAFLPAAERFDLISSVDRWIIARAFSLVAECVAHRSDADIARCAVNLSGGTLSDDTLLTFIKTRLSLHNLPGQLLCSEITGTAAISKFQAALRFIRDLRVMGCRFALDDFGSGLPSFSYLKNLLVDNINVIGHLLGKRPIAEYANDGATLAVLQELGGDCAQDYGISKPQPLDIVLAGC